MNSDIEEMVRHASRAAQNMVSVHKRPCHETSIEMVRYGVRVVTIRCFKKAVSFAKATPGIGDLCNKDLAVLIQQRLILISFLWVYTLMIDGEYYMVMDGDVQYSRMWMNRVMGPAIANTLFAFAEDLHELEVTSTEIALIIALTLCKTGRI